MEGALHADGPRADQNADRRHQRRALAKDELLRILETARWRPLAEYGRGVVAKEDDPKRPRRSRATWTRQPLAFENLGTAVDRARQALKDSPALIARLERIGRERALIYQVLVTTGLRSGELRSVTVGQLDLDGPVAYVALAAGNAKNRRGANIPIRQDVATQLTSWLQERLDELRTEARKCGRPIPARLPASAPLFRVPSGLSRIFDRDLTVAGIPKRDERNRVIDVHGLRVTFCSHLCSAGISLRVAQACMRHSTPGLTANTYTDPKLFDIVGAINALPALVPSEKAATGTTNLGL